MAKRKTKKKAAKKSAPKRRSRAPRRAKATARRTTTRRAKPAARRRAARRPASNGRPPARIGVITHTELASTDPMATREWCQRVLGWKFGDSMSTPTGPYHMWRFDLGTGGGIRANNPPEPPGSIPYCEVASIQATYAQALAAGAHEMLSPQQVPGGMGWIAIVAAPGGVPIGFWAEK